jgi:CheY-like chemotaxis protein
VAEGESLQSQTILVVENDRDVLDTIAEAIRDTGRQVFTAMDGGEALSLLDIPGVPRPCLVLVDWFMESMNGEVFIEHLAGREDFKDLAILVMSASRIPASALPPGVIGALPKPFALETLLAVLDEHC